MELSENKLSFSEKLSLKYYNLKKNLQRIHRLGSIHVSILLIPHNQEKIFKLSISYYLLYFISIILAIITVLSLSFTLYFVVIHEETKDASLKGNREKIFFQHHQLIGEELEETIENLTNSSKDLDSVIWGKSNKLSKFEFFDLEDSEEIEEQNSNLNLYQNTNKNYSQFIKDLKKLKSSFQSSMDYLETRESIFASMPRGRPLGPGIGLITSTFGNREDPFYVGVGEFHNGIDFASANGTPIYATAPGVVVDASSSDGGLGLHIRIEHENGFHTTYGHCSELFVKAGDIVKRGDIIAAVGSSGKATGSHLHYEVRVGNDPAMNPQEFINID